MTLPRARSVYTTESKRETVSETLVELRVWRSRTAVDHLRRLLDAHGAPLAEEWVIPLSTRRCAEICGITVGTFRAGLDRLGPVIRSRSPLVVDILALEEAERLVALSTTGLPVYGDDQLPLRLAEPDGNGTSTSTTTPTPTGDPLAARQQEGAGRRPRVARLDRGYDPGIVSGHADAFPLHEDGELALLGAVVAGTPSALSDREFGVVASLARLAMDFPATRNRCHAILSSMFEGDAPLALPSMRTGTARPSGSPARPTESPGARFSARSSEYEKDEREERSVSLLSVDGRRQHARAVVIPIEGPRDQRTARSRELRAGDSGPRVGPPVTSVDEVRTALLGIRGGFEQIDDRGIKALQQYSAEQIRAAVSRVNRNLRITHPLGVLVSSALRGEEALFFPQASPVDQSTAGTRPELSDSGDDEIGPAPEAPAWALDLIGELSDDARQDLLHRWHGTIAGRLSRHDPFCDEDETLNRLALYVAAGKNGQL